MEEIFYQSLEYVIAPIGLMIFLFYVTKRQSDPKSYVEPKFLENGIESLFIASYSHILYYFSLVAHHSHHHSPITANTKSACLMTAIIGFITIYVLKYYENVMHKGLFKFVSNYSSALSLAFLFLNICYMHFGGWYLDVKVITEFNLCNTVKTLVLYPNSVFIFKPQNFVFILVTLFLIAVYVRVIRNKTIPKDSVEKYINGQTDLSKNLKDIPWPLHVDILVNSADLFFQKSNYANAILLLVKAKDISCANDSAIEQLYGIDKKLILNYKLCNDSASINAILAFWRSKLEGAKNDDKDNLIDWIDVLEKLAS